MHSLSFSCTYPCLVVTHVERITDGGWAPGRAKPDDRLKRPKCQKREKPTGDVEIRKPTLQRWIDGIYDI